MAFDSALFIGWGQTHIRFAATGSLDAVTVDESRRPAAAATVVLIPSEESRLRLDRYRSATTDSAGRAALTNIAPGSYKLFAWQDIEANAWQNADALRPFEERGVPVGIEEYGKVSQTIKVIEQDFDSDRRIREALASSYGIVLPFSTIP